MSSLLVLAVLGCNGSKDDSVAAESDTDTDTGGGKHIEADYSAGFSMDWRESGFVKGKLDTCKAAKGLTIHVDAKGDLEGKMTCTSAKYGDVDVVFAGSIVGKTEVDGTLEFSHNGYAWKDVWDGEIEEGKSLSGTIKGYFSSGSLSYSYDAVFTLFPS